MKWPNVNDCTDPAGVNVTPGEEWIDDRTQRRFRILAVGPDRVKAQTIAGRTAGHTYQVTRLRFRPGYGYRRVRTPRPATD